jgi:hypothetical protein
MNPVTPNFAILDSRRPQVATLMAAMLRARDAISRKSWSHPQEPTSEEWWADVLADPRARRQQPSHGGTKFMVRRAYYTLGDENHEVVFVACSKCEWKAAFVREELIATHGRDCPMPNLLDRLADPGCPRSTDQSDAACTMLNRLTVVVAPESLQAHSAT